MKKFLTILLIIATLCCLVACGDKSDGDDNDGANAQEKTMFITINGNKLEVALEDNSATKTLVEKLKQGNITYTANDYGNFEKVGSLGFDLPTSDRHITTQVGDVILYSGNQIVLFYGSNSWNYTRLGKIVGHTTAELRSLLGAGNGSVEVTLSLQ